MHTLRVISIINLISLITLRHISLNWSWGVSNESVLHKQQTAMIVDGAAAVHKINPGLCSTFEDYCDKAFKGYIMSCGRDIHRIDLVFDAYWDNSLKSSTRLRRGTGDRVKVTLQTPIPKNWNAFLKVSENKEELFHLLAKRLILTVPQEKISLLCTIGPEVISNNACIDYNMLSPCNHEEADSRMLLHVKHASMSQHANIMISTVDSDVLIIALQAFHQLNVLQLWMEFGVGKHKRYIPCHEYAASLGPDKCSALAFWHAFSGCDTVSSFSGRGKKTVMDAWTRFEAVTPIFISLSSTPHEVTDEQLSVLEHFVVTLYDRTSPVHKVNQSRQYLFTKKNRTLENIPPTQSALKEHAKRAAYQAGHVWKQSLQKTAVLPEPANWGWRMTAEGYKPMWTVLPEVNNIININNCFELELE